MSTGLSLLLVRPQLLLANLHHLVLAVAYRLSAASTADLYASDPFKTSFDVDADLDLDEESRLPEELIGQLGLNQEIIDKVRGMESKLEYQIKKLSALAESQEKAADAQEAPEEGGRLIEGRSNLQTFSLSSRTPWPWRKPPPQRSRKRLRPTCIGLLVSQQCHTMNPRLRAERTVEHPRYFQSSHRRCRAPLGWRRHQAYLQYPCERIDIPIRLRLNVLRN